jgi:hypothetical protein
MTHSKEVTPLKVNKMAKLALWASIANIIFWLLMAIPGFLVSNWSAFVVVTIPLSAMIALLAGIIGLLKVVKYGTGVWPSVTGIIEGILNVLLIGILLVVIYGLANSNFW